jgi:hypothetical protein
MFERSLVPVAERLGLVVIDGGTDAGVMRLIGRARTRAAATFPLVGVPAAGTVRFPGKHWRARRRWPLKHPGGRRRWPLDAHHSHFVLVPGTAWGDEAPWIARVATELAGGWPSLTVLVNGGDISYTDVACSLRAGRPVLTIAGSGRTADQLASAARGGPADEDAMRLAASGLVEVVDADDLAALDRASASGCGARSDIGNASQSGSQSGLKPGAAVSTRRRTALAPGRILLVLKRSAGTFPSRRATGG